MPDNNKITTWRPDKCTHCELIPYWYSFVTKVANNSGYNVTDLLGDTATKPEYEKSMVNDDPIFFGGVGHGSPTTFTGQNAKDAVIAGLNDMLLSHRITSLISCLTAQKLGPSIVKQNGQAYLGYFPTFNFYRYTAKPIDQDPTLGTFIDFSNLAAIQLLRGENAKVANDMTIARCNYWIRLWQTNPPIPSLAGIIISAIIHDRKGLRLLGDPNAKITPPTMVGVSRG